MRIKGATCTFSLLPNVVVMLPRASAFVVFIIKEVIIHPPSSAASSGQAVTQYRKATRQGGRAGARWLAC